ncbi:MAG: 50S ribosomal protein L25 [Candidatus Omnitrophica bacterium]|nr:50S ribosomal protein L25 [Candidatus Omnitrophota bacterium]
MSTRGAAERPLLGATSRTVTGTRAVRRLRREGFVPGILYGKSVKAAPVLVSRQELIKFLHARAGEHGLLTLRVEIGPAGGGAGAKATENAVLIKRVEHDPVNGDIRHVDFQAIVLTEQIRIKVPLMLNGEPVGVKQDGGVLEHFLREVEVECLPTQIPKQIEHDVSAMKIGDTVHVRDLAAPAGTRITTDPESGIASILVPKEEKPAEAAAEAVTEPEVIREKKPEAEEAAAEGKEEKKAEKPEKKEEKKKEEK